MNVVIEALRTNRRERRLGGSLVRNEGLDDVGLRNAAGNSRTADRRYRHRHRRRRRSWERRVELGADRPHEVRELDRIVPHGTACQDQKLAGVLRISRKRRPSALEAQIAHALARLRPEG
jgi:hypothetical protein